jgi:hypothetical protein
MGKRKWVVTLQPHPTPDGQERLVRALRLIAETAPRQTRASRDPPRARGLDAPADDRMNPPTAGGTPAKEDKR